MGAFQSPQTPHPLGLHDLRMAYLVGEEPHSGIGGTCPRLVCHLDGIFVVECHHFEEAFGRERTEDESAAPCMGQSAGGQEVAPRGRRRNLTRE